MQSAALKFSKLRCSRRPVSRETAATRNVHHYVIVATARNVNFAGAGVVKRLFAQLSTLIILPRARACAA